MRKFLLRTAALLIATIAGAHAQSGGFPNRPVRIVVPLAPGGNVDIVARSIAVGLSERLGQQVIVENRPGASSLLGTQAVAKSPADGYTLLAIANTFATVPAILKSAGYDPVRDFVGITLTCRIPMVLVAHPSTPASTLAEFVALAKAKPGTLAYGTSGTGSTGHIAGEMFSRQAGVQLLHVPYKGNAQAMADLLGGQLMFMFDQLSTSANHIRSGKLRAIAAASRDRAIGMPELTTLHELGMTGFDEVTYNGLLAPAGTPADVVARLHAEVGRVLATPEARKRMLDLGIEPVASASPAEFSAFIRTDADKYLKLVRDAGIKAE
jgi:tripartite-type tricarboxylate transporter receptor subunit TctC